MTSGRLLDLVSVAAGALDAQSDEELASALLARTCQLLGASYGAVLRRDGDGFGVLAEHGSRRDAAVGASLQVPLVVGRQAVGELRMARATGEGFGDDERALLGLLADRFALVVERIQLHAAERSARASAEQALALLREKEQHYHAIFDAMFHFVGLLAPDGTLLEANRSALEFAGVGLADVAGQPFWDTPWWTHAPSEQARLVEAVRAAASGQPVGFETTHRSVDGRVIDVDFSIRPVRDGRGPVTFLVPEGRDVTAERARRRSLESSREGLTRTLEEQAASVARLESRLIGVEADLAKSETLHRAVVDTVIDGLIVIDARGIVEWLNPAAQRMFGYEPSEIVGRNVNTLMPAPYQAEHDGYIGSYLRTGVRKIIGIGREVQGRRKNGSAIPAYLAVSEMRVDGERKFTGVVRDLTEQKTLAESARIARERYDLAARGVIDGLWERDFHADRLYVSDRWAELFGYAPGEILAPLEFWRSALHPDDRERVVTAARRHLAKQGALDVEYRALVKTGEYRWFHSAGQAVWDDAGKPVRMAGSMRDITEQRRIEERLQEQETLAQIGEMASVVAHEVRNPLAAIRGVVEVIRTRFPAESSERQVLGDVLARVDTLDELVNDLLVYARPTVPKTAPGDLLAVLRETAELLRHDPEFAGVDVQVEGESTVLMIDRAQIGRALLNLMTNAAQAMKGRGTIRATCRPHDTLCRVMVADSGPGMPPDVLEKATDAFFTTRTRGTGLGLPIAKRVVEQHGGRFGIESTEALGTTVTIDLPVAPSSPTASRPAS